MREIKFRAWDEKNRCFVNPSQVFINLDGCVCAESDDDGTVCAFSDQSALCIEQFTGLRDKNGKEIYEGDITKDSTGLCLVTWNPLFACFCLRRNGWAFDHFFGEAVDPFNCEVLGNIHENPELLSR